MKLNAKQQALWERFKPHPSPNLKDGELKAFERIVKKITIKPLEDDLIEISYELLTKEEHLVIEPSWGLLNLPQSVKNKIKALDDYDVSIGKANLKPSLQVKLADVERRDLLRQQIFKGGRDIGSSNKNTQSRDDGIARLITSKPYEKVEVLYGDEEVMKVRGEMSLQNFYKIVKKIRTSKK